MSNTNLFIERLSFLETLCLKNIKSFAHQRNWLGVQTPELSVGVKNKRSNDNVCDIGDRFVR